MEEGPFKRSHKLSPSSHLCLKQQARRASFGASFEAASDPVSSTISKDSTEGKKAKEEGSLTALQRDTDRSLHKRKFRVAPHSSKSSEHQAKSNDKDGDGDEDELEDELGYEDELEDKDQDEDQDEDEDVSSQGSDEAAKGVASSEREDKLDRSDHKNEKPVGIPWRVDALRRRVGKDDLKESQQPSANNRNNDATDKTSVSLSRSNETDNQKPSHSEKQEKGPSNVCYRKCLMKIRQSTLADPKMTISVPSASADLNRTNP